MGYICRGVSDQHAGLQALTERSLPLVRLLREEYATAIEADSNLELLYDNVVSRHLGVAPSTGMSGLLSKMFEMLNGDNSEVASG